ncbi:MAG TPA: hypothetical protein VJ729_04530 [Nitrososphaeraceae archaeon]|nr:hypothetical protein [Nitrososphaeraceae archaeon]
MSATTFIIFVASIMLLLEYPRNAQAFPCIGDHVKEYCIGYHDGAVQADRDYKTGNDIDIDQHPCSRNITEYCHGYNSGYNDEADFLG